MDPRLIIRGTAESGMYFVTDHCLKEMDKDGLSPDHVESVMIDGTVTKRDLRQGRFTLSKGEIMICVEINQDGDYVTIITAGRRRRN